jgi:hypothetical protein
MARKSRFIDIIKPETALSQEIGVSKEWIPAMVKLQ